MASPPSLGSMLNRDPLICERPRLSAARSCVPNAPVAETVPHPQESESPGYP